MIAEEVFKVLVVAIWVEDGRHVDLEDRISVPVAVVIEIGISVLSCIATFHSDTHTIECRCSIQPTEQPRAIRTRTGWLVCLEHARVIQPQSSVTQRIAGRLRLVRRPTAQCGIKRRLTSDIVAEGIKSE